MVYVNHPLMGKAKQVGELQSYPIGGHTIRYRDIIAADGSFTRIEYFDSVDPTVADASEMLESRRAFFAQEQDNWKTLICGTLSTAAVESRFREQFILNPQYKDPRKWFGAAADYVERLLFAQKSYRCNTVFTCHIGRDKDEVNEEFLFTPDLPGRLGYGAGRLFNEIYRVFIWRDEHGVPHRYLQTDGDGRYQCGTHIKAPNPLGPNPQYSGLWKVWDETN